MAFKNTLFRLTQEMERISEREIVKGYNHRFDENGITNNLLYELKTFFNKAEITDLSLPTKIYCDANKYSGKLEYSFGDIAVLVKIHYTDSTTLEGVGFLEAKKRYKTGTTFKAFDISQIHRIYRNAPNSFVLAFNPKSIVIDSADVDMPYRHNCRACIPSPIHTNAVVIPNNIIVRENKLNSEMYRHSIPLSYQFCYRYLLGFDLNFGRSATEKAIAFAKSLSPRYLISFDVVYGDVQPTNLISLNLNIDDSYETINLINNQNREE